MAALYNRRLARPSSNLNDTAHPPRVETSDDAAMSTFYLVALLFASVTLVIAGGALTLIGNYR